MYRNTWRCKGQKKGCSIWSEQSYCHYFDLKSNLLTFNISYCRCLDIKATREALCTNRNFCATSITKRNSKNNDKQKIISSIFPHLPWSRQTNSPASNSCSWLKQCCCVAMMLKQTHEQCFDGATVFTIFRKNQHLLKLVF